MLTYLGTNIIPMPTMRDVWPQCPVTKGLYYVITDEVPLRTTIPFENVDEDDSHLPDSTKATLKERLLLWILDQF